MGRNKKFRIGYGLGVISILMDVRYGCCWNVKDINLVYIGDLIYNVIWKEYVIRIDN